MRVIVGLRALRATASSRVVCAIAGASSSLAFIVLDRRRFGGPARSRRRAQPGIPGAGGSGGGSGAASQAGRVEVGASVGVGAAVPELAAGPSAPRPASAEVTGGAATGGATTGGGSHRRRGAPALSGWADRGQRPQQTQRDPGASGRAPASGPAKASPPAAAIAPFAICRASDELIFETNFI